ncbi:MAG TPA: UdgX family uracil-DNA binding protein [Caldimonas sp.]|jgi:DNA polymerase|nr:UdgX family uracil-DNA binding protein [Caldimonas sp.]HEX2540754.1 UdgX family uracil-DNA binding protein [Caldimonas sp.]
MTAAGPRTEPRSVTLASAVDFEGFRRACRQLWAAQVPPDSVSWHTADDAESDLFERDGDDGSGRVPGEDGASAPIQAPASFVPLSQSVVLHSDPARFGLLYRLLWRLQLEPGLRGDPVDADWVLAEEMAQAVRRDMHKMKAFVRFRTLQEGTGGAPLHVAWFEPEHHIVEATAPFFARRFTAMRWAILTPERSVRWDGEALAFGPGGRRDKAPPADAGERLWLTYYESIFNPARLKLKMMQKEMPKRYWPNLPEAQLIQPLTAHAAERSLAMIQRAPGDPPRKRRPTEPQPAPGHPETPGGDAPPSLPTLREALDRCRECPIGEHATQAVPGEGPTQAPLMFVGEQPGDQEDLQGRPFVGPAGQLLARALDELGISRDKVYVTNAVKHFKFELRGKRRIHKTPAQQEVAACLHWLESEIELVEPQALVALGATAARQLLGAPVAVTKVRGQWLTRSDGRRVLITLHPSALLRMEPADKAAAYAAWLDDLRHAVAPAQPASSPRP